jgi:REP element-mobilizing transposase RayT
VEIGGRKIFRDDLDYQRFLVAIGEVCAKTEWQIHAYCLMRNHFHLVIETPQANLVTGMKWLLGTYTKRFNIRHQICGHLFAGRYKALIVDGSGTGYLRTVCDYVHLNPARAKVLRKEEPLEAFPWCSYREYLKRPRERPVWLRVDRVLGEHGIPKDTAAGRRGLAVRLESRRKEEKSGEYRAIRKGWFLGDAALREELLAAASERVGANHYGSDRRETGEAKARRLIAATLTQIGWKVSDLKKVRKGAPEKVELARRLRKETTMSLKWIAKELEMGRWTYVSNLLGTAKSINSED